MPIAAANPDCRFVVPAPRWLPRRAYRRRPERLIAVDAGERIEPLAGLGVTAIRAAHETLERTPEAGTVPRLCCSRPRVARLYHSGDTIPYEGTRRGGVALGVDLALLPVNGPPRRTYGRPAFPANLTLDEACLLAERIGASDMIAHHYGMFAFNTEDPRWIDAKSAAADCRVRLHRAKLSVEYRLSK